MNALVGLFVTLALLGGLIYEIRCLRNNVRMLEREVDCLEQMICTQEELQFLRFGSVINNDPEAEGLCRFPADESEIDAFGRWLNGLSDVPFEDEFKNMNVLGFQCCEDCCKASREDLHEKSKLITTRVVFDDAGIGQLRFVRDEGKSLDDGCQD